MRYQGRLWLSYKAFLTILDAALEQLEAVLGGRYEDGLQHHLTVSDAVEVVDVPDEPLQLRELSLAAAGCTAEHVRDMPGLVLEFL